MTINISRVGTLIVGMTLSMHGSMLSAGDFDRWHCESMAAAFELVDAGRFNEAVMQLRPYAEHGNPRAQLFLATFYRTSMGAKEDEYEAAKWYRKAAQQGLAEAQFHFGLMYLKGVGVTENSDEALEWISRAAGQGYDDAMDVLSYILNNNESLDC